MTTELKAKLEQEISTLVETLLKSKEEVKTEEVVEKSENDAKFNEIGGSGGPDTGLNANGGGDVIKNKDKKDAKIEKIGGDKKPADKKKDDDEEDKEKKGAKKSMEDTNETKLEKSDKVEVSQADFEFLQKALADKAAKDAEEAAKNDPNFKMLEGLTTIVKSLVDKVDTMSKTPARDPKALTNLGVVEKSSEAPAGGDAPKKKLAKSQVLRVLGELQKSGLASANDVIEYEIGQSISNRDVKNAVESELRKQGLLQ